MHTLLIVLFQFGGDLTDIESDEEECTTTHPRMPRRSSRKRTIRVNEDSDYENAPLPKKGVSRNKKVKFSRRGANDMNMAPVAKMKIDRLSGKLANSFPEHNQCSIIQELAVIGTSDGSLKVANLLSKQQSLIFGHYTDEADEAIFTASSAFAFILQAESEAAYANLKTMTSYVLFTAAICRYVN